MTINPKIKERAEKIRKEVYGKDVREALASGLEAMSEDVEEIKQRQDNVESQFQAVLDETTGKDVISAPEVTAARVGADGTQYSNLKQRLDSEHDKITAQLAQKAKIILSDKEPSDVDDETFWYEDRGEAPINFNPDDAVIVANAVVSDTEPRDTDNLWFDVNNKY